MEALNLPTYSFNINSEAGSKLIFDPCRLKWVTLTPEEWVRQNFVRYMLENLGYPAGLISTEMAININGMKRRCDIVVHNRSGLPVMITECKAPEIGLDQSVFDQANSYNWALGVPFLVLTNGMKHYCLESRDGKFSFRDSFPSYDLLDNHS